MAFAERESVRPEFSGTTDAVLLHFRFLVQSESNDGYSHTLHPTAVRPEYP